MPDKIYFTESAGVADSIYGNAQAPIAAFIETRNAELEQKSVVPKIFKMEKSSHFGEMRTGMTGMTGFRPVGENGDAPEDTMEESYSSLLKNVTFKDEFRISREMVEDSKLIDFKKRPQAFIDGFYRARENHAAMLLGGAIRNAGADVKNNPSLGTVTDNGINFNILAADKNPLFATDHPSKIKEDIKQCNCFKDAFSVDSMAAAECAMQNFRGDNDDILDVVPDTIVIPNVYALKKAVFAAVGADKDPATANNGFNFMFGRWNIIVWNYLNRFIAAGTNPWIMLSSEYNNSYDSLIFQDRTPLDIKSYIEDSNDANVWHGYARFAAGFHDWRGVLVGGVAAGNALIGE